MDFFAQQDLARRNTRLLVLLFAVALAVIIGLVFLVVTAFLYYGELSTGASGRTTSLVDFASHLDARRFAIVAGVVAALIGSVSLFRWLALSSGGKVVAEGAGGRRVLPQSTDPAERRALNIVEEMALASNMPVPPLYVLEGERSVNAFAAGTSVANAVVAVTRGTLDTLTRDELQGVVAHEFSHILNGDMRLSIRLIAMLKGITALADVGGFLMRSSYYTGASRRGRSSDGDGQLGLVGLGLALWVLGSVGGLMASLIKAAVSRQKEYLADASAVQFTRNPEGISSALKVIGGIVPGSLVHSARTSEISHLFFAQALHRLWQGFATHPPLAKRIRRLDAGWDGKFIARSVDQYAANRSDSDIGVGRAAIVAAAIASRMEDTTGQGSSSIQPPTHDTSPEFEADARFDKSVEPELSAIDRFAVPSDLAHLSHEPLGAQAILFGLLMHRDSSLAHQQYAIIEQCKVRGLVAEVERILPALLNLHPTRRLPLTEMCLPALKSMSEPQYQRFQQTLLRLAHADQHIDLYEWCLFQLVSHYLAPEFSPQPVSQPRHRHLSDVRESLAQVLSTLVWEGLSDMAPEPLFAVAAESLGVDGLVLLSRESLSVEDFSRAVYTLADCYPLLKPRVLKAMALAAGYDGVLSAPEREIIAAIAAVMDCPVPDSLLV